MKILLPENNYKQPFLTAFAKGYIAGKEGKSRRSCPYEDKRGGKFGQVITYSRAFITAWNDGWAMGHSFQLSETERGKRNV